MNVNNINTVLCCALWMLFGALGAYIALKKDGGRCDVVTAELAIAFHVFGPIFLTAVLVEIYIYPCLKNKLKRRGAR